MWIPAISMRIFPKLCALVGILLLLAVFSGPALADGCPNAERRTLEKGETFTAQGDKCWVVDKKFVADSAAKDKVNKKINQDLADERSEHDATMAELAGEKERTHQEIHKKKKWRSRFWTVVVVVATFVAGGVLGAENF